LTRRAIPAGFFVPAKGHAEIQGFPAIRAMLRGSNIIKCLINKVILLQVAEFCGFPRVKALYLIVTIFLPLIEIQTGS
jgi:hypothetical protein